MRKLHKSLKNAPPIQRITLEEGQPLPPPNPYASWMEYAIATANTHMLDLDSIDGTYPVRASRSELRQAIRDEYYALCKIAGIEVTEESRTRIENHLC